MAPPSLTVAQKNKIALADGKEVIKTIADLRVSSPNNWLPSTNPFRNGLPPDQWSSTPGWNRHIIELLAASAPNHCIDGWGFLARSLSSLVAGDGHAARHFAYYAELRAALCILALNGIGVFNYWNCIVDVNGNLEKIDGNNLRTHTMAWLALEEWSKGTNAGAVVGRSFTLRKVSFDDSLKAMWPGTSGRPIAYDLIMAWGVDLKSGASDRNARNESSYFAQDLNRMDYDADKTVEFIKSFWEVFEPESGDPFSILDKYLFRITAETQYGVTNGKSHLRAKHMEKRQSNLDSIIQPILTKEFMARYDDPDDPLIIKYAKANSASPLPVEMISRGALLLRTATAILARTLYDAGVGVASNLQFWLDPYGSNLGFWSSGNLPLKMDDLWSDIQVAIDDATLMAQLTTGTFDRLQWASSHGSGLPNGIPRIFETERIALWGLC